MLTVKRSHNGGFICQTYHTYGDGRYQNLDGDDIYVRTYHNLYKGDTHTQGWSPWKKQLSTKNIATTAQVVSGTSSSLLVTPKAIADAYMLKSAGLTPTEADKHYVRNDRNGQIQGTLKIDKNLTIRQTTGKNTALRLVDGNNKTKTTIYSDNDSRDAHWMIADVNGAYVTGITLSQNGNAYIVKGARGVPKRIALFEEIHNVIAKKAASQHDVDSAVNIDKYVTPQTLGKPDIMMYKGNIKTNTSMDDYVTQGLYNSAAASVTNRPENKAGVLVVLERGTNGVYQTYTTYENVTYTRTRVGGNWGSQWSKLITDKDLHHKELKGNFDWNTITKFGTYVVESPTGAHKPDGSSQGGILTVSKGADKGGILQTYTRRDGVISTRVHITNSSWFPWKYHGAMSLNTATSTLTITL